MASRARRRRRLSLTPLIDVIFLLLLFFMLSSTFSRFSEIELSAAGGGGAAPDTRPLFLQLLPDDLRLNGRSVALDALGEAIGAADADAAPRPLLVALKGDVTAQRLTDLLAALRGIEGVAPTILGGSAP